MELTTFPPAHRRQQNRFEVLTFCCGFGETLKSIPELEQQREPIKTAVRGGKGLPFPGLLDHTFPIETERALALSRLHPEGAGTGLALARALAPDGSGSGTG